MGGFIEPNMHPVIVHFGFALIITALVAYLFGARRRTTPRGETLVMAGDWMLAFGSLAIIATAASGLWAYYTVAHDSPSHEAMTLHRNWALPTAGAVLLIGAWRWTQRVGVPSRGFIAVFALACTALTVTAWLGGKVVYEHGIGVQRLPIVTDDGHDHDHGDADPHGHEGEPGEIAAPALDGDAAPAHDNSDGHHETEGAAAPKDAPETTASEPHAHDDHAHDQPHGLERGDG